MWVVEFFACLSYPEGSSTKMMKQKECGIWVPIDLDQLAVSIILAKLLNTMFPTPHTSESSGLQPKNQFLKQAL